MTVQNTQDLEAVEAPGGAQPQASVGRSTQVVTAAAVVASLTPAAYVGRAGAIALARWSDTSGPLVSIMLVAIAGVILGIVGAGAFALANRWPKGGALAVSAAAPGLLALSVWMLINVVAAQEALLAFGITVVVLSVMAGVFRLFGGK